MRTKNNQAMQQEVLQGEYSVVRQPHAPLAMVPVKQLSPREQAIVENTNKQLLEAQARRVLVQAGERITESLVLAQMNSFMTVAQTLDAQAAPLENTGRAGDVQQYIKDKLEDYAALQKQRLHRFNQTLADLEQEILLRADDQRRGPLININIG